MSLKYWIGALEDAIEFWLGLGIFILILIWSLVYGRPICLSILILKEQRLFMYFKYWFGTLEDAGGSWLGSVILIIIWIWSLAFDTPLFQILALSWFWRCKEHPCPLCPNFELWKTLEVPDSGLASWYWFGYGHLALVDPSSKIWLSILILKAQRACLL